jgi:gamma-glutamylputrescine oxidase
LPIFAKNPDMQLSYWERESFFGNIDVAVIGSGIVGLNAAWSLKKKAPALNVTVFERGFLPYGASTRNAGFACFGSVSELLDDLSTQSEEEVFSLVEKRYRGLQRLRENLGDKAIQFQELGGFELFAEEDMPLYHQCLGKIPYLNKNLRRITGKEDVYRCSDEKIGDFGLRKVRHLLENTAEGQIDTGQMMKALLEKTKQSGVTVITGIHVSSFEEEDQKVLLRVGENLISAGKVLIATNGFARELFPELPVKPGRAQVLITKPVNDLRIKGTFHYNKGYYYFRNVGNRVLLGGGRNLDFGAEETTQFGLTGLVQKKLDSLLSEIILPDRQYEVDMRWSGIMGLGDSKSSIVNPLSERIFCSVRMGGMGVAIGSLIGEEAAQMILET